MVSKRFWDAQFGVDVQFVGDCSAADLRDYVIKKFKVEIGKTEHLDGCIEILDKPTKDGGRERCYMVWVRERNGFYTLVHECLHLAKHIMVDRLMPFDESNDELIAYMQAYWFKKMWRLLGTSQAKGAK